MDPLGIRCVALLILASCLTAAPPITASEIIARIQKKIGISGDPQTVDTIKAGDPNTPITGIATTFSATLDVLKRAAAAGQNLIVAHEPTFYHGLDSIKGMENDPVLTAKQAFIAEHRMVVFRFHDGWHAREPDGILLGMTKALGWEKYQAADRPHLFTLPENNVATIARTIKDKLRIQTARYVGDPAMRTGKIGLIPGAAGSSRQMEMLRRDDVNILVIGETREWETVEYVRDAVNAGKKKALIILGHVPSEEAGMEECARWLKTFIPEVPVAYVPAGEPFRAP